MTPKTFNEIQAMTPDEKTAYNRELSKGIAKFFFKMLLWKLGTAVVIHVAVKAIEKKLED